MAKVRHRVGIDGPVNKIFSALVTNEGFAGWWASSADIKKKIGGRVVLTFDNLTVLKFKYTDVQKNKRVALICTDGPGTWQGSELIFDLTQADDQVFLTLTHQNDLSGDDDFLYFNTKWTCYLLSLKDWVETGSGNPYPNDIKIHVGD